MNRTIQSIRMAGLAALVAVAAGCGDLFEVDSPGQIADEDLNTPDAVPGLVAGMSNRLSNAMGSIGGNMVIYSALVSGEMYHGGSYTWDEDPVGITTPDDNYLGGTWGAIQVARWVTEAGLRRMYTDSVLGPEAFATNPYVARAYLIGALANRTLGEIFCSAVFDGGAAQSSQVYFDRAMGQADSAIAIGGVAGSGATSYVRAAYGVRASLKAWGGDWAGAATDAQNVPASFVYNAAMQLPDPFNEVWDETHQRNEYTVWSTFMSDTAKAQVENMDGPAWLATHPNDPRARWTILRNANGTVKVGQNGYTYAYQQNKYDVQTASIPLVKGTEMLVLRAEAALRAGTPDIAGAYALMNQARALTPYNLPALAVAPDLATAWKDLHYERGATVWLEGRHLWDAARWYNETGPSHSEAMAGRDQCLPVSLSEINSNLTLGSYRASLSHPYRHQ
jgi:hypothetical protein